MARPLVLRREYTLPWSPIYRDILMDRIPVYEPDAQEVTSVIERYNIPPELWPLTGAAYGWGPDVAGGLMLSLNILDRWIPKPAGDTASFFGQRLACRQLAVDLMPTFYTEWLAKIPYWGGVLHGGEVGRWVAAHVPLAESQGIDLVHDVPGFVRATTSRGG